MLEKAVAYHTQSKILTLVANFIIPQGVTAASLAEQGAENDLSYIVSELNKYLAKKISCYEGCYIADVNCIAATMGKRYFLNDVIYFYTQGSVFDPNWSQHEMRAAWTHPDPGRIEMVPALGETYENRNQEFLEAVFRQVEAIYRIAHQIDQVKLVIFDLDNTMWRGLLGEHYGEGHTWPYFDNWPMGVWEAVQHLRRRGIIVSIASKNDLDNVVSRWEDVVQFGFVKFDDFTCPQVNWNPKASNIANILSTLSLTPKSVVFVDDNPVEREAVKAAFPEIRTIGSDPFVIRRILLWAPETQLLRRNQVTLEREDMLKKQVVRESSRVTLSREEFLASLNCSIKWRKMLNFEDSVFPRVYELVNKTNQFNTNGKRWSCEDYRRHFEMGGKVLSFQVEDNYTSYGLVGVLFIINAEITQCVMSCRVLGMEVEQAIIALAVQEIRNETSVAVIKAGITETSSNMPCRDLYIKAGFNPTGDGMFELPISCTVQMPSHVKISENYDEIKSVIPSIPKDFESQRYFELHDDVAKSGQTAEFHYLNYGINEGRPYK